jgi:hypothetical protein
MDPGKARHTVNRGVSFEGRGHRRDLTECLIKKPYELVVPRRPLIRRYYMDPARKLFPKSPVHILASHQAVLSSVDFLRFPGEEKIDEERGSMGVSGVFR